MQTNESVARKAWVAAFGKHPGWDDHIDDIGLVTPDLVAFKRHLYFEGVSANIDAGVWDRLPAEHRLAGFQHVFLSCAAGRLIVGRMWASRDGKGRSLYPMVVCAQIHGIDPAQAVVSALPGLAELETRCRASNTAAAVQAAVAEMQARIEARIQPAATPSPGPLDGWLDSAAILAQRLGSLPPADDQLGFQRFSHRAERDLAAWRTGASGRRATPGAQHVRVPACEPGDERALLLWAAVFRQMFPDASPLLVLRPAGAGWVDVLVGEARAAQFACLLAGLNSIPLVTEIPYTIDAEARLRHVRLLDSWKTGAGTELRLLRRSPPGDDAGSAWEGLWRRVQGWLAGS